jgi:hypothetical protein
MAQYDGHYGNRRRCTPDAQLKPLGRSTILLIGQKTSYRCPSRGSSGGFSWSKMDVYGMYRAEAKPVLEELK